MKRFLFILICFLLSSSVCLAEEGYESLKTINSFNWVKWFDQTLGFIYDSHGCLHFSPADIFLLYKTLPAGIPLKIKKYQLKKNEPPFSVEKVPYLSEKTDSSADIEKHRLIFKNYKTEILIYPSLDLLFILVNGYPYAKVCALAGPPYEYLMAYEVQKGKPVQWDFMLTAPTDPGKYKVLRLTDHYLSSSYYQNTIVPFGAWIRLIDGKWLYQKKGKWYKLPNHILADLARSDEERIYNYYDINLDRKGRVIAARYAGHDFGKYVLLWTRDGKYHYPEMGYAAGELVYEQIVLIKDLVHLLTVPAADDLASVLEKNQNFKFYRSLYEFKLSRGKQFPAKGNPTMYSYYKLFNGFELDRKDQQFMDARLVKALKEYEENRLPRHKRSRWEALGLYNFLRVNSLVIDKLAGWYERVMKDWELFKKLRMDLRRDFDEMGVLSLENRQNIVEGWLNHRLEFKKVSPPRAAKHLTDLSFSTFFKPDEESLLFTERERAVMLQRIKDAVQGKRDEGLNLEIVEALNRYNFGVLLNEILGDLYKSHGCMHVSPRNALFLYELLPVGAQMKVYQYSERVSEEAIRAIPYLADQVNFAEDLDKLKQKFAVTSEVKVAVYPYSGDWIVYLKEQPFARLRIRGGPQTKFYLLQGRDKDGNPIFESYLAYPTTPGDFYIFKKVEDYVSNIYHDQTIIPMGEKIQFHQEK
ncbi:MAG: L,D-transpeptidase, partial [Candidatus Margulisiibacteriota bacterium]